MSEVRGPAGARSHPGLPQLELDRPREPLGLVPRAAPEGGVVWEYTVDPAHHNPHGSLHGGVLMTLLDTAMGWMVAAALEADGRKNAAAQMSVSFLAPVRSGTVRATARMVKLGRRLAVVEASARDDSGNLVATATATHALLP
jgi:uncharacterized protein (TIGR00369 family)